MMEQQEDPNDKVDRVFVRGDQVTLLSGGLIGRYEDIAMV